MKKSGGEHVVGYNVQGAVDAKHHLLVTTEVTNTAADQGQLARVAQAAKTELEIGKPTWRPMAATTKAKILRPARRWVWNRTCPPWRTRRANAPASTGKTISVTVRRRMFTIVQLGPSYAAASNGR